MEPITEQELKAFIGANADYYLRTWWPALNTQGAGYDRVAVAGLMLAQPKTGFNWAAFILSGLWLPYRKLYLPALILFGFILVESALEDILFVGVLRALEPPAALGRLIGLAAAIVCGSFGNRWYLSHARKVIADVRSQGLAEEEHLRVLSRRGGTSLLASLGFFAVFAAAIVLLVIALELLHAAS